MDNIGNFVYLREKLDSVYHDSLYFLPVEASIPLIRKDKYY